MDAELRKLQRLYQQNPTDENFRAYRYALIRRGLPCGLAVNDLIQIQEHACPSSRVYLTSPWVAVVKELEAWDVDPRFDPTAPFRAVQRIDPDENVPYIYLRVNLVDAGKDPKTDRRPGIEDVIETLRKNDFVWLIWPRDELTVIRPA